MRTTALSFFALALLTSAAQAQDLPATQRAFVQAITDAREAYRAAPSDLLKGATRQQRRDAICAFFAQNPPTEWWLGTVTKLGAADNGQGVLAVAIADGVTVTTWNNHYSDWKDHTLVPAGSAVFDRLTALAPGDRVWFRAALKKSATDCVREISVTLDGSMTQPAFLGRFRHIRLAVPNALGALVPPPPPQSAVLPAAARNGAAPSTPRANGSPVPGATTRSAGETRITPLGNGATVRQQGSPDRECHPLGNGMVCR